MSFIIESGWTPRPYCNKIVYTVFEKKKFLVIFTILEVDFNIFQNNLLYYNDPNCIFDVNLVRIILVVYSLELRYRHFLKKKTFLCSLIFSTKTQRRFLRSLYFIITNSICEKVKLTRYTYY